MRIRLVVAVLLLGCASLFSQSAPKAKEKTNAELLKADRDFFAATQARKAAGWMEFMTEETTLSREKAYSGLAAIREAINSDFADPNFQLTWDPETAVLLESGEMGYTSGHYVAVTEGS